MAIPLGDVAFPLYGGGSTAAVTDQLRLRLLHFGGTTIDERWGGHDFTAPHWRVYLNLDAGAAGCCAAGDALFLAGHLYVIPAWLPWSGRCRGRVRHINGLLDLPSLPRDRVARACTRILRLAGPGQPLAEGWLALGVALMAADGPSAIQTARGYALAYEAVAAAFVQLGRAADALLAPPGDQRLADVLAWTERHLAQPLSVASLAHTAGCSQAELARRFQAGLGTAPGRWLRERRLAKAADLLRSTTRDLEDIACACGYRERSRFSKAFAALMGCGPATWRRRQG